MSVIDYLDAIKGRLVTDAAVSSFQILRARVTSTGGYLRARLTLSDGGMLEFSEYVQRAPGNRIQVVTYSYHWADAHGNLIRRWDNAPHFPSLPGFPHHVHDGATGAVMPGQPVSVFVVLDEIALHLP